VNKNFLYVFREQYPIILLLYKRELRTSCPAATPYNHFLQSATRKHAIYDYTNREKIKNQ